MPKMQLTNGEVHDEWPVFLCEHEYHPGSGEVHYHVTRGGSEAVMWNGYVHENGGFTTVPGRRFSRYPSRVTPVQECTRTTHPGTPHLHSTNEEGAIFWRALDSATRNTPVDGLFGKDEHVTARRVIHRCTEGPHSGAASDPHTHTTDGMWGNPETRPSVGVTRLTEPDGSESLFSVRNYTTEAPFTACEGSPERESTMNKFKIGDPVIFTSRGHSGERVGIVVHVYGEERGVGDERLYTVLIGTRADTGWSARDLVRDMPEAARSAAINSRARFWNGRENHLELATEDPSRAVLDVFKAMFPEAPTSAEEENIRPLRRGAVPNGTRLTLHSRPGVFENGSIRFGCQSFPMSVLSHGGATVTFGPSGPTVVMDGVVTDGRYMRIGDRLIGIGEVNEWTTKIVQSAVEAPAHDAIVMEFGLHHRCTVHPDEHVLFLLNGADRPVLGRIRLSGDGTIGQSDGFDSTVLWHCRPAPASATASVMGLALNRRYGLVPVAPGVIDTFSAQYPKAKRSGDSIVECDRNGQPLS